MATNERKKKKVQVSLKLKKCANPLFEKWLQEWKVEAASKGSDMQYCFGKALKSLQKYPLPLKSGRDCGILDYFGNRLCLMLDRRLAEYKKDHPAEIAVETDDSSVSISGSQVKFNDKKSKVRPQERHSQGLVKQKDPVKRTRKYVPALRSGPYALLVTLLDASQRTGYAGFLTKPQLQMLAQPLCETSFKKPDPSSHYTAWSSMSGLVKRGLVLHQGCPAKFSLTEVGTELAQQLKDAANGNNPTSNTMEVSDDEDVSSSAHPILSLAYGGVSTHPLEQLSMNEPRPKAGKLDVSGAGTVEESLYSETGNSVCKKPSIDVAAKEDTIVLLPGSFDIILLVDKQETVGGPLLKLLQEDAIVRELTVTGTLFELRHLKVGDYAWICRDHKTNHEMVLPYIVERKRMDDLAKSIRDGRYREQKFRLKRCGIQNLIYLVESQGDNTHTTLPLQSLEQATVNTQVVDGFTVKKTSDVSETVLYLATMTRLLIKWYSKKTIMSCQQENIPPSLITNDVTSLMMFTEFNNSSSKRKVLGTQSMFIKQLVQLNGLSVTKAQAIVNSYPTPRVLMAAYREVGVGGEKLLASLRYGPMNRMIGPVIKDGMQYLHCKAYTKCLFTGETVRHAPFTQYFNNLMAVLTHPSP